MARKSNRVDPSFDEPRRRSREDEFALRDDDRVLPSARGRKSGSGSRSGKGRARDRQDATARRKRRGLFGSLVYWGLVLGLWAVIAVIGVVIFYGAQMPSMTTWAIPDRAPNVKIVDRNEALVANRGASGGEAVELHEMSPYIPQAVIAIEDRRFYSHFGVDPIGLTRAVSTNLVGGRMSQGGSTLTQQLAKNLFLTPERSLKRKVQEVLLSFWLEHKYTKDQILEMYLNRVYFGSGAYGVEAASRRYFGKSARKVTLAEAALLGGLLKAPSKLSPARDPQAANDRAQIVLGAMRDQGRIDAKQMMQAASEPPTQAASYWTGSENYVADRVMDDLPSLIGEVRSDVIVETTIDLKLQKAAEEAIKTAIEKDGKKLRVSQGALVAIGNGGGVRAMVGGFDYAASQFDRAADARRQPGSAFKPFVYLAAIEQGRTPDSMRNDAPIRIGKWTPQNYKGKYYGQVTLTTALAKSLNSVAAQLAQEVGAKTVVETARRLGVQSPLQSNVSIALGTSEVTPLELTAAYVPFANGGYRPQVHFVKRVTTADGKELYRWKDDKGPRVISDDAMGMMNAMMARTISSGTAGKADFGWPAAGKTGTSQNSKDAWFVGYTANLTTGVWFGNDDGSPTKNITGGSLPAIAWHNFMSQAHKGLKVKALPGNWHPAPPVQPGVDDSDGADQGMDINDLLGAPSTRPAARVEQPSAPEPVAPGPKPARRPAQPTAEQSPPRPAQPVARAERKSTETTASVKRPQADVGGPKVKQDNSIMDIILGN